LRSRDVAGALREAKQVLQMVTESTAEKQQLGVSSVLVAAPLAQDNATCAFGELAPALDEQADFGVDEQELAHMTRMSSSPTPRACQ